MINNRQSKKREYMREYYQRQRLGNPDNIKRICLEHGFSEDVAEAIALDGVLLDKKLNEKIEVSNFREES